MATVVVSVRKRVVQTTQVDVSLEDLAGCTWVHEEGKVSLFNAETLVLLGYITSTKDLVVYGSNAAPAGVTFGNIVGAMRAAGVW